MKIKSIIICLVLLFSLAMKSTCAAPPYRFSEETLIHDEKLLNLTRQGLKNIIGYMQMNPELFPQEKMTDKRLVKREQRANILSTWQIFLQHIYTLDVLGRKYNLYYHQLSKNRDRQKAFNIAYSAFLAQYRYALDFISICEKDPTLHIILNEADSEISLSQGLYKNLKFRFLNVFRGIEFARLEVVYNFLKRKNQLENSPQIETELEMFIAEDSKVIWQAGKKRGPEQTAKNAVKIVQDTFFTSWFPIQKEVSEWIGDTKVFRLDHNLISKQQIKEIQQLLQPGDILIERREWYLSNLGLPGYWSHAALYVGTKEEREAYFSTPATKDWLKKNYPAFQAKNLDDLLLQRYPKAYQISLIKQPDSNFPRVIEAISEGVSFTTLEHSADADSIAVLRPKLDKTIKAEAIVRAFSYIGRPYDFNFDFITDEAFVCTEVIFKAYEPTSKQSALNLPVRQILGRNAITANDIIKLFAAELESEQQQFEFIVFLDGYERGKKAINSDIESLKSSWLRPNWHILVQDTILEKP